MQTDSISINKFQVTDLQRLTEGTYRITLQCQQGYVPEYFAGQYLEIILPEGEACAFSIASPPTPQQTQLELHIQKVAASANSSKLFTEFDRGLVSVRMPKGKCYLQNIPDKPLLFIAAGTGFAQMKSMIELVLNKPDHPHMHLYWGARSTDGFYLPNLPIHWLSQHLHYHPVISDPLEKEGWKGRQGLLYEAVIDDKENLLGSEVYISGSPQMVYATYDALVAENFSPQSIHSDVFEYAPRD